jgi:hypothetical protein
VWHPPKVLREEGSSGQLSRNIGQTKEQQQDYYYYYYYNNTIICALFACNHRARLAQEALLRMRNEIPGLRCRHFFAVVPPLNACSPSSPIASITPVRLSAISALITDLCSSRFLFDSLLSHCNVPRGCSFFSLFLPASNPDPSSKRFNYTEALVPTRAHAQSITAISRNT